MTTPLVFVTVGTDHHPFTRLVEWVDAWAARTGGVQVVVQYGTAPEPAAVDGRAFLAPDEYAQLLATADAVVCAGGPGGIMETRAAGLRPVVVPRRAALGEHVDDHQRRFADFMAARDLVTLADDEATLTDALDAVVADPSTFRIEDDGGEPEGIDRIGSLIDALVRGAA